MLLRESGNARRLRLDLAGIVDRGRATGVAHADVLLEFADAIMDTDRARLDHARDALVARLGPRALVEVAITAANFSIVDRVANAIGIPLDRMALEATRDFRAALGINSFLSARNTPLS